MALWKTKPDIVVFLGDLLNDGSIFNDTDFYSALQHFKNLLSVPDYVKVIVFEVRCNIVHILMPHVVNMYCI